MMRKRRFGWIVGAAILVAGAFGLYLWPRYLSPLARQARSRGYDPIKYAEVKSLQMQVVQTKGLSSADVARLEKLACDDNPFIAARALTALWGAAGTEQAEAAQDVAREKLSSDHPLVRSYALSTLAKLRAPDTREHAERMLKDPNVDVRKTAERILAKPM